MTIGIFAVGVAFIAAVVSTTAYALYYRDRQEALFQLANRSFVLMGLGIVFSLGFLIYLIQTHNFQVNYVYSYSSRSLSKFYLFSTLWAGQQGTFLLWLFYGTIYGLILMRKTARKKPLVMFFLLLVQSFLLLILLKKSPFSMIWHEHAQAPVGFTPADGAGLNPLLQNPWMVIHPPTLFVGYSSTMIPFAFAMAALISKDVHGWIKDARPWVIFNVMVLGVGIVMGGYWAYETLGWGGYWAWDPVENASLVPWFFSLILLHGIMIQAKRKALVKSNFALAGMAFLTMVWGSFLTRSGVLTDFSVHSFGESGLNWYLLIFQGLFIAIFLGVFIKFVLEQRNATGKPTTFSGGIFNRETFILMGMMFILLNAITVLFGTSAPIYTSWFGKASSVSPDFYNSMIQPVAIFLLLTMAIAPLLAWKITELRNLYIFGWSGTASLVITLLAVAAGLRQPNSILIFFLAVFAIVANGWIVYRFIRKDFSKAGGYFAHVGLGFMVIGIITSSIYDSSEKVMLPQGEFTKTDFGYEVRFDNFVEMPDGRDRVKLMVKTQNGKTYEAYPQFYYSDYSQAYMISPDVRAQFTKDIYISPISFTPARLANRNEIELGKTESTAYANMEITFNNFLVKMGGGAQEVTADLTVQVTENSYSEEYQLAPMLKAENGQMSSTEAAVPNTPYRIKVTSVNPNAGTVKLAILSPGGGGQAAKDMLAIEVSEKPLISILWFGTIIFALGSFLTLVNRIRERKA